MNSRVNDDVHQASASLLAGERTTRNPDHQQSLTDAGWSLADRIELTGADDPRAYDSLSWGNLRTLFAARREKRMGQHDPDIAAGRMRRAWHEGMDPPEQFALANPLGKPTRVLVLGDTGDGSEAQMAVARQMEGRARDGERPEVAALLIQSDIVYPAGAGNEYDRKFFRVYEELHAMGVPI